MRVALIAGYTQSLVNFRGPLIEALIAAGHTVDAIGPDSDADTLAWLAKRGVLYTEIPLARATLSPLDDVTTLRAITNSLRIIAPDVVIAYTIKAVIYGMLAARIAGVPQRCAMITGLGYAFTNGDRSLKRRLIGGAARALYRIGLGQAQKVIFQNPDDLAVFRSLGIVRPFHQTGIVNGSGVDTTRFALAALPPEPVFLMIARLIADKGVGEYLQAARQVKKSRPEARFHLVGPADPNPAALPPGLLEQAVADGVVHYDGELADVRPAIAGASVYVLPSYREGTPRSVLEAMAMGRAIITTDAPGCRETVVDGLNGYLVPVKAVDELAQAMISLIDDPTRRSAMGTLSRELAVAKYDAQQVAKSSLDLLALS